MSHICVELLDCTSCISVSVKLHILYIHLEAQMRNEAQKGSNEECASARVMLLSFGSEGVGLQNTEISKPCWLLLLCHNCVELQELSGSLDWASRCPLKKGSHPTRPIKRLILLLFTRIFLASTHMLSPALAPACLFHLSPFTFHQGAHVLNHC